MTATERKRPKVRVFRESPEAFFRAGFTKIANTRMKNVPICNPRLHVSSVPFKLVNGQWIGGIVTPWSLLVIQACATPAQWVKIPETKVSGIELPGGEFSFMGIEDPEMGVYHSCSLLSPTWEVGDQATAEAVVRISLETMLTEQPEGEKAEEEETEMPVAKQQPPENEEPREMTRREIFSRAADAVTRDREPAAK